MEVGLLVYVEIMGVGGVQTYGIGRFGWAIHYDVPVVDVVLIDKVDFDSWRRGRKTLCKLLCDC